jgi:hypothetical protein
VPQSRNSVVLLAHLDQRALACGLIQARKVLPVAQYAVSIGCGLPHAVGQQTHRLGMF